jgi:hypothetical protein
MKGISQGQVGGAGMVSGAAASFARLPCDSVAPGAGLKMVRNIINLWRIGNTSETFQQHASRRVRRRDLAIPFSETVKAKKVSALLAFHVASQQDGRGE